MVQHTDRQKQPINTDDSIENVTFGFRDIPQVEKMMQQENIASFITILSQPIVTTLIREQTEQFRLRLKNGEVSTLKQLENQILRSLRHAAQQRLQPVINATGIMIHTNLGRAPIPVDVWRQAEDNVCRYSNLELNLAQGTRGNRMGLLPSLLNELCGSPASLLVNNNAAALTLMLMALAQGKEVLVSRGEQVQIGGGFRIPTILACSGAKLCDVGTTNITTVDDYLAAVTENTAAVLLVHTSNYYIQGFTSQPDIHELVSRLPEHVQVWVDQGSGNQESWLPGERSVAWYLAQGVDLVCFSTDKMLNSTQGGVIVGRQKPIALMAKHPLMRAFRPGKTVYALLEAQLIQRLNQQDEGQDRLQQLPHRPLDWHLARAQRLCDGLNSEFIPIKARCLVGGGTTPRKQFLTYAVRLPNWHSAADWLDRLRLAKTPVIAVSQKKRALLFPISLLEGEFSEVNAILKQEMDLCSQ